jgi:hypothetical protein
MTTHKLIRGLGAVALLAVWGCQSLDVTNPNLPDKKRALGDPASVEALGAGAIQTWFNAYTDLRGAGVTNVYARTYSSSWNNGNLNYHQGIYLADASRMNPADTTIDPLSWTRNGAPYANDPAAAARTTIEAMWGGGLDESATQRPGMYASLSSANLVLNAIRNNGLLINNDGDTQRAEGLAALMQGASLMVLALQYDKAYILDENTDPATIQYSTRDIVRDSAVSKLIQAAGLFTTNAATMSSLKSEWTNGGESFSPDEMAKIAYTMAAMTIAWYPRDSTEAAAADWATVKTYASQGITFAGCANPVPGDIANVTCPGDWTAVGDGYAAWVSELMDWFDGMDGGRVHSRVAHLMDPVNLIDPYPLGTGSPTTWVNHGDSTIAVTANNQISRSAGSWIPDSVVVGDYVQLASYKTATDADGNYLDSAYKDNGFAMLVTAVTPTVVTVQGTPLLVSTVDAGAALLRIRTPNSPDLRMGDGTFASQNLGSSYNNVPSSPNRGTDFAWLRTGEIFRSARGFYAQSNVGQMRYDASGEQSTSDVYGAFGAMPAINWELNELLLAEADLRTTDLVGAVTHINSTRVNRGGLASAAGLAGVPGDGPCMSNGKLAKDGGVCTLWSQLNYEYEIELLGLGPAPYWHQRGMPNVVATAWERATGCRTRPCTPNANSIYNGPRFIQGLLPGTPREMPVPAKELGVKGEALYTWGGTGAANSPTP